MAQEAIQEIDSDVFSRRIGPYFTWLESRIESGWEQSESMHKDVLKEVKQLATSMRARFILGVGKNEFVDEVQKALELFELALDAFPGESDEVEGKMRHFSKGIAEELGPQFLPDDYMPNAPEPPVPEPEPEPQPPEPEPTPPEPEPSPVPEPEPEPSPDRPPMEEKIRKTKVKKVVVKPKVSKPVTPKVSKVAKPKVVKPVVKAKPVKKKQFSIVKHVKYFIFGDD